jgi:hypothetical protein
MTEAAQRICVEISSGTAGAYMEKLHFGLRHYIQVYPLSLQGGMYLAVPNGRAVTKPAKYRDLSCAVVRLTPDFVGSAFGKRPTMRVSASQS